jgi:hypothetical protein
MTRETGSRNHQAPIELEVVRGDQVDLLGRIEPPAQALARPARRVAPNDQDVRDPRAQLALRSVQLTGDLEDQVVATSFDDRAVDADPEPAASNAIAVSAIAPF